MISDVLCEAGDEIRRYLREFKCYDDDGTRAETEAFLAIMDRLRVRLDSPSPLDCPTPDSSDPTEIAELAVSWPALKPDVRKLILGVVRKSRPVDERKAAEVRKSKLGKAA